MSSVFSVSDPNDLDVSMEIAKPEEGGWTFSHGPLRRITNLLMTGESNSLDLNPPCPRLRETWVLMVWQPCTQKMFCGPLLTSHIAEDSTGYLSSDTRGRVLFTILSQLIDRSQRLFRCALCTSLLMVGCPTQFIIGSGGLPESSLLGRTKKLHAWLVPHQ